MRHALIVAWLALTLPACGGSSPSSPSPTPARVTVTGTITDTVSGATVGAFSQDVPALPTMIAVSAAGHLTRQAWVTTATPSVDLIPDAAPFSIDFYRQMARNGFESPSSLQPLARLTSNPSIYLQSTGFTPATIAAMESAARAVVPAMTGGRLSVAAFETGAEARLPAVGWITAEIVIEPENLSCGRANVGLAAGHIWLNEVPRCAFAGFTMDPGTLAHELGHALGFWHDGNTLMNAARQFGTNLPSDIERYHAAIAYSRASGNRDVDQDAAGGSFSTQRIVVVD